MAAKTVHLLSHNLNVTICGKKPNTIDTTFGVIAMHRIDAKYVTCKKCLQSLNPSK